MSRIEKKCQCPSLPTSKIGTMFGCSSRAAGNFTEQFVAGEQMFIQHERRGFDRRALLVQGSERRIENTAGAESVSGRLQGSPATGAARCLHFSNRIHH